MGLVRLMEGLKRWSIVNDVVMGGRSGSELRENWDGRLGFRDRLSLANNGGFAAARTRIERGALTGFAGVELRVRGDGRRYRLCLRSDRAFDGATYQDEFETSRKEWIAVRLPFTGFRGRIPAGLPPLEPGRMEQLGFMIGGRKAGPFHLEIARVRPYGRGSGSGPLGEAWSQQRPLSRSEFGVVR